MHMLTRRLQILLDEARYRRLEQQAQARGTSIATVVRDAIDHSIPSTDAERQAALDRILAADPMELPEDPAELKREHLDDRHPEL